MPRRRAGVLAGGFPHLVDELDVDVVGYSYVSPYRPRPAYRFTVENSVYVRAGLRGRGVGRALLGELLQRCGQGPWRQMIAVIGDTANPASIDLPQAFGFRRARRLTAVGFKLWHGVDSVVVQAAAGGEGREGAREGKGVVRSVGS